MDTKLKRGRPFLNKNTKKVSLQICNYVTPLEKERLLATGSKFAQLQDQLRNDFKHGCDAILNG